MTTTDPFTTAQIIDQHRPTGRWVGNGVRVECVCGHESRGEHAAGPQTDEENAHRDADRKHAQHVADMLAAQEPTDAERAVRELHRQYRVYEHEDACPDPTDEHREAHHHEDSDGYGENYCDRLPLYKLCEHCRDEDGERVDWPCATTQALGVARRAQTGDAPSTLEQRIRDLHTTDPDGNCAHCTRGRIYPIPAPCDTIAALTDGGDR